MKKILVLGAGLSTSDLISYLLENASENSWILTVGDMSLKTAKMRVSGYEGTIAKAIKFDINNNEQLISEVESADLVISMLPARYHPLVARACVDKGKHMITASYISQEIKELDKEARSKDILLLNEIGVDPGIDHMSAMRILDNIRQRGGIIDEFESYTGGLIAPESDNNPWNYKFTWNPRNVVLAGQGISMFLRKGNIKYIPYNKLFTRAEPFQIKDYGFFEVYPNRDSLKYREIYGLENISTILRGTIRRRGFCESWNIFVQLGMTDDSFEINCLENMTWRDFVNTFLDYDIDRTVEEKVCSYTGISADSEVMKKLKWLGIFRDKKIGLKKATPAQVLQKILEEKLSLGEDDKDMIVMQHRFAYRINNTDRNLTSTMVVTGRDRVRTAMSATVGLPVAIAAKMLLTGKISLRGVQLPVMPELYNPVLDELEKLGIVFREEE